MKTARGVLPAALLALAACTGLVSNLDTTPTNDLPNPYRSIVPWGKLKHAKD